MRHDDPHQMLGVPRFSQGTPPAAANDRFRPAPLSTDTLLTIRDAFPRLSSPESTSTGSLRQVIISLAERFRFILPLRCCL